MKKAYFRVVTFCGLLILISLFGRESFSPDYQDTVITLQKRRLNRAHTSFMQVFFPPHEDVRPLVCSLIDCETRRVDIEAFQFTDKEISEAVLRAFYRGVEIHIIVDIGALGRFNKVIKLSNAGIPVYVYPKDGITNGYSLMHNKIILLHSLGCVITGSMNLTTAGIEKNHENVVVIQDDDIFTHYAYQFNTLLSATSLLGENLAQRYGEV